MLKIVMTIAILFFECPVYGPIKKHLYLLTYKAEDLFLRKFVVHSFRTISANYNDITYSLS